MIHGIQVPKSFPYSQAGSFSWVGLLTAIGLWAVAVAGCHPLTEEEPSEQAPAGEYQTRTVRIAFLNTHLLPDVALRVAGSRSDSDYRATAIAERLAGYDVIGLCETFDNLRAEALIERLREVSPQEWYTVRSPERTERRSEGGLLLASRFPIEDSSWRRYEHSTGLLQDGLAGKGVLHARLRLAEGPTGLVDCFLTHLDSQSANVRRQQVSELDTFMAELCAVERPIVLLGDLNIAADVPAEPVGGSVPTGDREPADPESTPYHWLLSQLHSAGEPLVDVWSAVGQGPGGTSDALAQGGGRRIDYIFLSPQRENAPALFEPHSAAVLPLLDEAVSEGSLSDHAAVTCEAVFHWRPE